MDLLDSLQRKRVGERQPVHRGISVPVSLRAYGDDVAIVDVLVYRPKVNPYWSPDTKEDLWRLKYF